MNHDKLKSYLSDTVFLLIEMAEEVEPRKSDKQKEFLLGVHMGLVNALSLFYQQALVFEIDPREIGFKYKDKDPEEYLL